MKLRVRHLGSVILLVVFTWLSNVAMNVACMNHVVAGCGGRAVLPNPAITNAAYVRLLGPDCLDREFDPADDSDYMYIMDLTWTYT